MPAMPRLPGKGTEIAYKILGKPNNMKKPKKKQQKINARLVYEETFRAR